MKRPDLLTEHRLILKQCGPSIEELRSHNNSGTDDVVVIVDCAAFEEFARGLGLAIPPKMAADAFVLAIGLVPLSRCQKAFASHIFPKIAQGLRDGLSTPLAYRTIVMTERGATTAQNIYVPAKHGDA